MSFDDSDFDSEADDYVIGEGPVDSSWRAGEIGLWAGHLFAAREALAQTFAEVGDTKRYRVERGRLESPEEVWRSMRRDPDYAELFCDGGLA